MHTASIKKIVQKIKNDIFGFSSEHMLLFPTWMQIKTPPNTEGGLYFSIALWLLFVIMVILALLVFVINKKFKTLKPEETKENENLFSKILIGFITLLFCYFGIKVCIEILNPDLPLFENLKLIWSSNIKNMIFNELVNFVKDNYLLDPNYIFSYEYKCQYMTLIIFFKLRYLYFILFTSLFLRWKLKITKKVAHMLSSLPFFFKVIHTLEKHPKVLAAVTVTAIATFGTSPDFQEERIRFKIGNNTIESEWLRIKKK